MATEFVGIELQLMGADGVRRDLEQLDRLLNSLGGKKKFDMGLNEARTQVVAYRGELEKLRREQSKYEKGSDEWNKYASAISEVTQKLWNAQQAVREFGQASREAGRTFQQTFNAISSKVAHIGSAMQSFGNAMTNLTSPFRRLTSGIIMGAGFKVFNSFSEGFERGFTRYDTMKKYPKIMAAFGYSAAQAEESIKALDLSVRGLPTGLDEMVDLAQRFTATTGDIEKGTKLAIATNNAFLASMSTDTQRYQGMMQLQDVLGGKDMNAREWNSLVSSMTPAIVKMGEAMKESGKWSGSIGDFIQHIRDGKMDNQEFIDQLIEIGNEGGVLEAMAQESKNTWQAFFANVGNAAARMTAGIIQAFDEISQSLTGKDVNQLFADTIIPSIDNTTKSIKKWIKAHPEEITKFFKDLSKIKIGNFLRGYAKGLEIMIGLVERLATALGEHPKLMEFLGGFFGMGGMIGRMSTIAGGLLKGTRHIWAAIGAGGSWLLKGKFGKLGIFGKIASFFGKKKEIEEVGEIGKAVTTASPKLLSAFKNMALISGIVAMPAFTAWGVTAAVKQSVKNFKDTIELFRDMDWNAAAKLAGGIATFLGASAGLGALVGKFGMKAGTFAIIGETVVGLITSIAAGFFDADMALIKDGLKNFKDAMKYTSEALAELDNIKTVFNVDAITKKFQNVRDTFNAIADVFDGKDGSIKDRGVVERGMAEFKKGQANSIQNLSSILANIQSIIKQLNKVAVMKVKDPTEVLTDVKNACDQLQGIRAPKNIQKHTEFAAEALKNIRTMAKRFNSLAGMTINNEGFSAFVEQMRTALEDLKSLSQTLELDIKVVLGDGFKSSVDGVVKQINKGKDDIKDAVRKIPSAITKHISVTLTASVNTAQAVDAIENGAKYVESLVPGTTTPTPRGGRIPRANGGMIYRAYGGGVPFRRRGTDTVPAMLTPGEYVHNKRAVSAFGIDFMRKVNNLDMKGAMNELMHRAGHMANINRGTTITNNYNNNQKVVINNSNAGAGYTFKTASRFVGAF